MMRTTIVIFLIAAVLAGVQARPDVSLGYNQYQTHDLFAGATPNIGNSADAQAYHTQSHHIESVPSTTSYTDTSVSGVYLAGGSAGGNANNQQAQYYSSVGAAAAAPASNANTVQVQHVQYQAAAAPAAASATYSNGGGASSASSSGSIVSQFGHSPSSSQSSSISTSSGSSHHHVEPSQLPPIITKSFYFEAAPEEPEEQQAPRFVNVGRAQKNYKVIFIKAPSYGINSQVIPVLPQNEEKTIIYVLSKKPEFNQDIELPQVPTTEPTKPDIFFVKYKSEEEAVFAQHKIKNVYETQGADGVANAQFGDDQHIHSIVSQSVPNVYSSASGVQQQPKQQQQQYGHQQTTQHVTGHATVLGQRFGGEADGEVAHNDAGAAFADVTSDDLLAALKVNGEELNTLLMSDVAGGAAETYNAEQQTGGHIILETNGESNVVQHNGEHNVEQSFENQSNIQLHGQTSEHF